jgi:hypothetical protein
MNKLTLFLLIVIVLPVSAFAQKSIKFRIQVETLITDNRLKAHEDQFTSYILNELTKIPDVNQVVRNPAYFLHVAFFAIPCEGTGYDFYYRAHFFKKDFKDSQILSPLPFTEGVNSLVNLENLAKDIVAILNTRHLQTLR